MTVAFTRMYAWAHLAPIQVHSRLTSPLYHPRSLTEHPSLTFDFTTADNHTKLRGMAVDNCKYIPTRNFNEAV
jgi:hypothetical protein